MRGAVIVLAAALAACGGSTVWTTSPDATAGGGEDAALDAAEEDAPFLIGFGGDAAYAVYDGPTLAEERCAPPCAQGEYCMANVVVGGGRIVPFAPIDAGVDASPGCHAFPDACAAQPTCACVYPLVSPACDGFFNGSGCVEDDAGAVTVECYTVAP